MVFKFKRVTMHYIICWWTMTVWLDYLIKGGLIIDGSGRPGFLGDVGIKDGRIVFVGKEAPRSAADVVVDAKGLIVTPGFIDSHSHTDETILICPECENKLYQGITTEVVGNCGSSPAPITKKSFSILLEYLEESYGTLPNIPWSWSTLNEFYSIVESRGIDTNLVPLVGHGTLRIAIKGMSADPLSKDELDEMKALLEEAMREGAFGISTGLAYPPGEFATMDEIIELCKVVSRYRGVYTTHIRDEGSGVVDAVEEAIKVGAKAGIRVEISHLKVMGKKNWGRSIEVIALVNKARNEGIEVFGDVYPYTFGETSLTSFLPPWVHEGGLDKLISRLKNPKTRERILHDLKHGLPGWQNWLADIGAGNVYISATGSKNKNYEGKTLAEIAKAMGKQPAEALLDIIEEERGVVMMFDLSMSEEDLRNFIRQPWVSIGTDQMCHRPGHELLRNPHPRAYGTFPRVIRKYVMNERLIALEEAVRRMTSMPAVFFGLKKRGKIKVGYWADITVFDPKEITDVASMKNPEAFSRGIKYVFVNGIPAIWKGSATRVKAGKVLKKTTSN